STITHIKTNYSKKLNNNKPNSNLKKQDFINPTTKKNVEEKVNNRNNKSLNLHPKNKNNNSNKNKSKDLIIPLKDTHKKIISERNLTLTHNNSTAEEVKIAENTPKINKTNLVE